MRTHMGGGCLKFLAVVLLLGMLTQCTAGPLMAVDLGGEFLKVSVVKPGRIPISIVNNEMSKRRTSAQVAFIDGERLLGEEAAALAVRYPDRVYARARDLLGKPAAHASVKQLLSDNHLPYTVVADGSRVAAAIKTHTGEVVSAEELVAGLLHYAKKITEAAADGAQVLDCVIVVPPFFGPVQRQAIIDAADLAGLKVMSLINSHAAAALQYGIERDFTNKTHMVVLYDIGATDTEVALIRYSSFTVKEYGKPKTYSQFEVKDVVWDADLGAGQLDLLLTKHFAAEFQAKTGKDISGHPKALAKLKRQVKRTKEILSANTEAPLSVEELHDGVDFRSSITREAFEKLAGDFFQRAVAPLKSILDRNNVTPSQLEAVEILGGGSRIPALQAALSKALGGRALDKHLDADEAVALGAGLFAANLSTTFRLRKFGMTDGVTYPVTVTIKPPSKAAKGENARRGDDPSDPAYQPKVLLPFLKKLPAKRLVHLPNTSADALDFTLSFDASSPLPPAVDDPVFASFQVTGIKEVAAKHEEPSKSGLHMRADLSGILTVEKAEAVIDTVEEYEVQVPVNETSDNETVVIPPQTEASTGDVDADVDIEDEVAPDEAADKAAEAKPAEKASDKTTAKPTEKGGAKATDKGGDAADSKKENTTSVKMETVKRTRKKVYRVPLKLGGPGLLTPGMAAERKQAAKKAMAALYAKDVAKAETAAAKNDLESYIINTRDSLDEEEVTAVTTADERGAFHAQLTETEDWLYMEGEEEPASVFRSKLADLKKVGNPIAFRRKERVQRPKALAEARSLVKSVREDLLSWEKDRPWLNATDREAALKQVEEVGTWLEEEAAKQAALLDSETPTLTSDAITARTTPVRFAHMRLKNVKKPRPPVAAKKKVVENGTDDASGAKEEDGDAGDAEKKSAGEKSPGREKSPGAGDAKKEAEDAGEEEGVGEADDEDNTPPHDEL